MNTKRLIQMDPAPQTFESSYCEPDAHGYCATCSDEAVPARVLQIRSAEPTALVEINGRETEIDISLVEDVAPGRILLVHGGVAVGSLEEAGS